MIKSPLNCYEQHLLNGDIQADTQQRYAIEKLDAIFKFLSAPRKKFFLKRKPFHCNGLYLWGSVGIGKTYLMDLFYDCATFPKKRQHFFTFMLDIHKKLREKQGEKNPLQLIAHEIASKTTVLCFDEFFVSNIADAMILGELLKSLFDKGVVFIATSNTAPDNLYQHGLQRERFLPAIAALKAHTDVIHLTTQHDYRKTPKKPASVYFYPLNDETTLKMQQAFDFYNQSTDADHTALHIQSHVLPVIRKSRDLIWCRFSDLCEAHRSHNDYLALAQQFQTVLIDSVTPIASHHSKTLLRFIHLIDIFYDAGIRVIISAAVEVNHIYPNGPHQAEFARTLSRLVEMQSEMYFDKIRSKKNT